MSKPTLVAAAVLMNPDGDILMGLRADRVEWEVPGGKVGDEYSREALLRELGEETGLSSDDTPTLLGVSETDPAEFNGQRFVILFYLLRTWAGFPRVMEPEKCLAWRWFPLTELPPMEKCTPGTRDFMKNILPALVEARAA